MSVHKETLYRPPESGTNPTVSHPIIIDTSPTGPFYDFMLAREGYMPILLEHGEDVDARTDRVARFWETGQLNPSSNMQSREGGAGTFSDGKLNTFVKDTSGGDREVLRILTKFGGDPSILYVNKPHIRADVLNHTIKPTRTGIENLGGEIHFLSRAMDSVTSGEQGRSRCIEALIIDGSQILAAETVVLIIGHNARDTFKALLARGIPMESKVFAMGLRVQHPQALINESQCSIKKYEELEPIGYKLTWKFFDKGGAYSLCICPGGYVVNASPESGHLAVNGVNYHDKVGENANNTIIITVTPEDFGGIEVESGIEARSGTERGCGAPGDAMAEIRFQRRLEEAVFCLGEGDIPMQLYEDFKVGRVSNGFGNANPTFRGGCTSTNLRKLFPESLSRALVEGVGGFRIMIRGFNRLDTILADIENRTPSPVYTLRGQRMESLVRGILPCDKGVGYTGGITSAVMDGTKTAKEATHKYSSLSPSQSVPRGETFTTQKSTWPVNWCKINRDRLMR